LKTLGEFIDWHQSLGFEEMYEKYKEIHDPSVPGYVPVGKVDLPEDIIADLSKEKLDTQPVWLGVKSNYRVQYDERLLSWAKKTFPKLQFVKCRMQAQKPGESVREHMDLLGNYLRDCTIKAPWLRKLRHSIEKPGIDIHQIIIAWDDQVEGQVFGFHNPGPWKWKKGEYMRINSWRGMHWTANNSDVVRRLIKVTGIELGPKKENHVLA